VKQAEMAAQQTAVEQFGSLHLAARYQEKLWGTDEGEIPGLTSLCCVGGPAAGC
jgi:hypothetical protein